LFPFQKGAGQPDFRIVGEAGPGVVFSPQFFSMDFLIIVVEVAFFPLLLFYEATA